MTRLGTILTTMATLVLAVAACAAPTGSAPAQSDRASTDQVGEPTAEATPTPGDSTRRDSTADNLPPSGSTPEGSTSGGSTSGDWTPADSTAADPTAPTPPVNQTLAGGDVSLGYPDGFGLAVAGEPLLVHSVIPPCDRNFDYCLYYVGDAYEGTNFESAGVRIGLRADLTSAAACQTTQPAGYSGLEPSTATTDSYATATFTPLGQGAAGHTSLGELRRLYVEDRCYEFETRVAQTQFGNYEAGTIEEFGDDDQRAVEGQLRAVLRSVTLPGGRQPWP